MHRQPHRDRRERRQRRDSWLSVRARKQATVWLAGERGLRVSLLSWPLMRAVGLFLPTVGALCEMRYLCRTPYALPTTGCWR